MPHLANHSFSQPYEATPTIQVKLSRHTEYLLKRAFSQQLHSFHNDFDTTERYPLNALHDTGQFFSRSFNCCIMLRVNNDRIGEEGSAADCFSPLVTKISVFFMDWPCSPRLPHEMFPPPWIHTTSVCQKLVPCLPNRQRGIAGAAVLADHGHLLLLLSVTITILSYRQQCKARRRSRARSVSCGIVFVRQI